MFAKRQIQSFWLKFVIHIFCPFIIRSSPFLLAFVFIEATSDPAVGSLIPTEATTSPEILGAKNSLLNSSLPNL